MGIGAALSAFAPYALQAGQQFASIPGAKREQRLNKQRENLLGLQLRGEQQKLTAGDLGLQQQQRRAEAEQRFQQGLQQRAVAQQQLGDIQAFQQAAQGAEQQIGPEMRGGRFFARGLEQPVPQFPGPFIPEILESPTAGPIGAEAGMSAFDIAQKSGAMGSEDALNTIKLEQAQNEIRLRMAELQNKMGDEDLDSQRKIAYNLGKDMDSQIQDFREVEGAYRKLINNAKQKSAAGDLALIFNFMKMNDPRSTVRESEFDSAANARAEIIRLEKNGEYVPAKAKLFLNKLFTGEKLLDSQRMDFVNTGKGLYDAEYEKYNTIKDTFGKRADAQGLDKKLKESIFATIPTINEFMPKQKQVGTTAESERQTTIDRTRQRQGRTRRYNPASGEFEEIQ